MARHAYRIVNVFADAASMQHPLTGNPLCVFENGAAIDDKTQQALAQQFNLSESVFILPSDKATARIRIYTTAYEMPFAGHPTLGAAHVVRALTGAGDALTLETLAGVIPVSAKVDEWTLKANAPVTRPLDMDNASFAALMGLEAADLAQSPCWISTGNEQLIAPLASVGAVRRCRPDAARMATLKQPSDAGKILAWATLPNGEILARFFLLNHGTLREDFGTGSAAANLCGWFITQQTPLPLQRVMWQGEPIGRPAKLMLNVDAQGGIHVGGRVVELGAGVAVL